MASVITQSEPAGLFHLKKVTSYINTIQHCNVDDLKQAIVQEWEKLPIKEVHAAITSWRN